MSIFLYFPQISGSPIALFDAQEVSMHIHGNSLAVNPANFYSATLEEREAAAQRAASVRKKLMKNASEIDGASSPDEAFMIGQWMDSQHPQVESEEQYHASAAGKDAEFG